MSDISVNEEKYGDDEMYEAWSDVNLFFPISSQLVDPLHCMGLTPNMVTMLSTFFTFLAIYYLHMDNKKYAIISYLIGYILDCVDGRMARKYKMGTKIGMALDCTSDNVSNFVLFMYILLYRPDKEYKTLMLIILAGLSLMLSLSYGLNEAIMAYKKSGSDNFHSYKINQLKEELENSSIIEKTIYRLYLAINEASYHTYRHFFPTYDQNKIDKWLGKLKHFGPGNFNIFVACLINYA